MTEDEVMRLSEHLFTCRLYGTISHMMATFITTVVRISNHTQFQIIFFKFDFVSNLEIQSCLILILILSSF
jgi:hypothetical protein